jgi:hypothetical protein
MSTDGIVRDIRTLSGLILALLMAFGALLLLGSYVAHEKGASPYVCDFLKDLGIVIAAVCAVHLMYEALLAEKYFHRFAARLREEVEKGETNVATCAALGIERIFLTRDVFEQAYPLGPLLAPLGNGDRLRVVARSLFLLMSKAQIIKGAIERGAVVELCVLDPATPQDQASRYTALMVTDIASAVAVFTDTIAAWAGVSKPPGAVELRYHDLVLFDSYTSIHGPGRNLVVWDLSFGRDVTEKRMLLLDAAKPLAADLTKRYDQIFDKAALWFEYRQGAVKTDRLTKAKSEIVRSA